MVFLTLSSFVFAQNHDNTIQREAMKKLTFLEGNWNGEANMMVRGQGNQKINQTEKVQFQLGGTILIIEGLGKSVEDNSKTVHHAFAVISYDEKSEKYRFTSWLENGLTGEYEAYFDDTGNFVWVMESPNGGTIYYKIKLDENGHWVETGEWSSGENQKFEFFSMTLKKDH
jgi:hypothetical protein